MARLLHEEFRPLGKVLVHLNTLTLEWPASDFSLQYHSWITHKGYESNGDDHQLMELLTVKQVISLRTLGNAQRTVWKIYIEIEKYVFFVLSRVWDKEKILSPHEESNLRLSDSALRCSNHWATETPRWARSFTKFIWHASCILLGSAMSIA